MTETRRVRRAAVASVGRLLPLAAVAGICAAVPALAEPPPAVVDSQSIVRSLASPPRPATRALVVEPRTSSNSSGSGGEERRINLDIRFGNDSDSLTAAAHGQLDQLGTALKSPELAHARFVIAGHTSSSGAAQHNRQLSEARAQAVRGYLIEHCGIERERLRAVGYGADRPLPEFPPNALEQRRVEISTLRPTS
jgi:outer membrane protein OmpA-like peptidoglycan-associated protein